MFRHTFATHMLEAGVDIDDIKEMLGHDDATETTVYLHVTMAAAKRFLNDLISNWLRRLRPKLSGAQRLPALFISKKGNRLAVRTAEENFQKIVASAGPFSIPKVTPHSLRHAFASHAVDGKQDRSCSSTSSDTL